MTDTTPPESSPADVEQAALGDLVSATLRHPAAFRLALRTNTSVVGKLFFVMLISMAVVGLLMAAFSGGMQFLAVPFKVAIGTIGAMAVCLPSLFVFSNLSGSIVEPRQALGSMVLAVCVLAMVLLALAPIGLVFSLSTEGVRLMGWLHIVFLLVAAFYGGRALSRFWGDGERTASSPAAVWMLLFVVVLLQLSTTFRPLLGEYAPVDLGQKRFFLQHWLDSDSQIDPQIDSQIDPQGSNLYSDSSDEE